MAAERLYQKIRAMHDETQTKLIQDCIAGEKKAQYRLYRLYNKAMFNTCLRMLKNREDAEDVLQNSFIDIFTKIHLFRAEATIGAWIKRIVVNNCINYLKKKKIPLTDWEQAKVEQIQVAEIPPKPLDINIKNLQNALYQLSDGYRVVFSLYAIEGYDHSEISEILNISVSTSKSQYSRAKKRLREILNQSCSKNSTKK